MELHPIDRRAYPDGMRLWTWPAPDGWPHRRADWLQPSDRSPRGSLLVINGRGDFIEKWLEAITEWHRRGWSVASFDWRGQGRSMGNIVGGHLDSFDILVDDLAALIKDWQTTTTGPHVVVAHSMGAHLLLRLLVREQPNLAAAVLVSPMVDLNSGRIPARLAPIIARMVTRLGFGRRRLWGSFLSRGGPGSKRQRVLTSCTQRYEDELYWWTQEPEHASRAPTFGWINAAYRSSASFTDAALRSVRVPTLLIGTQRDALVSPAAMRRVAQLVPGAQLTMVDDCAHEILRERDAVRLRAMDRIDGFFDEHAG